MSDLDTLLGHLDRTRLEALLTDAVDAYSPSYSEGPAIDVFSDALSLGRIPFRRQDVPGPFEDEERCNLIVELGPSPLSLLWVGHLDTIPAQHQDPPTASRDGDRLDGLGAADMKSGCAAIVEALIALRASKLPIARGLAVGLVVGEEEYGDGAEALIGELSAPLVVLGEPTGLAPCTSHYGYMEVRLEATGTRAHAALPEVGANAIHAMLSWMLRVMESVTERSAHDPISVNPRQIEGGTGLFVVAESCSAMLDLHLPPGTTPDGVLAIIEDARRIAAANHPDCTLRFEQIYWAPGYSHDPIDARLDPLVRAFGSLDRTFVPQPFRSHSDGSQFHQRGSVPVVFGPGRLEQAHVRDEWVSLDETWQAARLYAALLYEACVRERGP
jgi:acetylornithine deacetylase